MVRFSELEIRVLPKLVGGRTESAAHDRVPLRGRLLRHRPADQQLEAAGDDLFELIVRLLVTEEKQLVREGLIRDYRPTDATLTSCGVECVSRPVPAAVRTTGPFGMRIRRIRRRHARQPVFGRRTGGGWNRVRNSKFSLDTRATPACSAKSANPHPSMRGGTAAGFTTTGATLATVPRTNWPNSS